MTKTRKQLEEWCVTACGRFQKTWDYWCITKDAWLWGYNKHKEELKKEINARGNILLTREEVLSIIDSIGQETVTYEAEPGTHQSGNSSSFES